MKKMVILTVIFCFFCTISIMVEAKAWMPVSFSKEGYRHPMMHGVSLNAPCLSSWSAELFPFNHFRDGEWGAVAERNDWVSVFQRIDDEIVFKWKFHKSILGNVSTEALNAVQPEGGGRYIENGPNVWRWIPQKSK